MKPKYFRFLATSVALLATTFARAWPASKKRALDLRDRITRHLALRYAPEQFMTNVAQFGGQDMVHDRGQLSVWPDATITVRHLLYKKGVGTNAPGSNALLSAAVVAAQTDVPLYVIADEWSSTATPGQPVTGQTFGGCPSTLRMVANASGLTVGDIMYAVASGYVDKRSNVNSSSTAYIVGVIVSLPTGNATTAAQGEVVEVAPYGPVYSAT